MIKERLSKIITVLTIASAIITVISAAFDFLLPIYLKYKFVMDKNTAGSIGIIGGADGPTAIFITTKSSSYLITIIFGLLTVSGMVSRVLINKLKRSTSMTNNIRRQRNE
ncbi:sodium ion-translocating decarboxylase subunit beta [Petroclostridium sp. X23]|uniref:sodium ion-translocating decarboxylase subunit beta n=1 Tax=Petroclostridium sp. X23 TaxID=3045146 RepID=UPI0024AD563F|nr:sodium ion-translocating decarboxylase subunit beta [Petroclostridium sp. X23]WHH58150.1 sodium ion-translocating decarboxylase subunit beta [Petroclostridium sp. X23]